MSIIIPDSIQAMASVTAGGASFLAGSKAPGFTSVANGGVGLNNLTLDQAAVAAQCVVQATPRSATADCTCQVLSISDTVKQVLTFIGGVASDAVAFDVVIFRMPDL